jgi:hypothetical protein
MDRRHWLLLGAALACIAGLFLWIGELDLDMQGILSPSATPSAPPSPTEK